MTYQNTHLGRGEKLVFVPWNEGKTNKGIKYSGKLRVKRR
jgi:hypothetical protein